VRVKAALESWRQRHGTTAAGTTTQKVLTGDPITDNYLRIMKSWQFAHCDFKKGNYLHHYNNQQSSGHSYENSNSWGKIF